VNKEANVPVLEANPKPSESKLMPRMQTGADVLHHAAVEVAAAPFHGPLQKELIKPIHRLEKWIQ
jgi:carbamoylphosphate synthase large subunit